MNRVAITGLGVISPVGNTIDAFWQSISGGTSGIDLIDRFDTADHKVKVAAQVKDFEPSAYLEKNEVRRTDLYAQYALAAAAQAVADSGITGTVAPDRLGVYVGSGIGGMHTFIDNCHILDQKGPRRVSPFFIPMMIGNIAAGSIAIRHNAQGPCLPVVTACATSTHALGEAFRAIRHGYADAIIAGGAEAAINPLSIAGFSSCMALTNNPDPSTACRPFDAARDGFVMGEGAGVLVLEEYERAKARGAHIYAELTGYGNTCDAHHITAPHPQGLGAAGAISQAMREAGITGGAGLYINAHGTSTPLNDAGETAAIKRALGNEAYKAAVSSTKSMTGHMLGAAGAAEAIASVLALERGLIPPTIAYTQSDPDCDLDYVPNTARRAEIAAALSISLGFGGHNGCLAFGKYAG